MIHVNRFDIKNILTIVSKNYCNRSRVLKYNNRQFNRQFNRQYNTSSSSILSKSMSPSIYGVELSLYKLTTSIQLLNNNENILININNLLNDLISYHDNNIIVYINVFDVLNIIDINILNLIDKKLIYTIIINNINKLDNFNSSPIDLNIYIISILKFITKLNITIDLDILLLNINYIDNKFNLSISDYNDFDINKFTSTSIYLLTHLIDYISTIKDNDYKIKIEKFILTFKLVDKWNEITPFIKSIHQGSLEYNFNNFSKAESIWQDCLHFAVNNSDLNANKNLLRPIKSLSEKISSFFGYSQLKSALEKVNKEFTLITDHSKVLITPNSPGSTAPISVPVSANVDEADLAKMIENAPPAEYRVSPIMDAPLVYSVQQFGKYVDIVGAGKSLVSNNLTISSNKLNVPSINSDNNLEFMEPAPTKVVNPTIKSILDEQFLSLLFNMTKVNFLKLRDFEEGFKLLAELFQQHIYIMEKEDFIMDLSVFLQHMETLAFTIEARIPEIQMKFFLEKSLSKIDPKTAGTQFAEVLTAYSETFLVKGLFIFAGALLQKVVSIRDTFKDPYDWKLLTAQIKLIGILQGDNNSNGKGNLSNLIDIYSGTLKQLTSLFKNIDEKADYYDQLRLLEISILNEIANVYTTHKEFDNATAAFEKCNSSLKYLESRTKDQNLLGNYAFFSILLRSNQARLNYFNKDSFGAEKLLLSAMQDATNLNHTYLESICSTNLCIIYHAAKDWNLACKEFENLIEIQTKLVGPDHNIIYSLKRWLANCYVGLNNIEKAETILEEILPKLELFLKPIPLASSQFQLLNIYSYFGKFERVYTLKQKIKVPMKRQLARKPEDIKL